MPVDNCDYTLSDLLDVLDVEVCVRELIDGSTLGCTVNNPFELEKELARLPIGSSVRFSKGAYPRMLIQKLANGNFKICGLFGVPPSNPRSGCSDALAPTHGLGLSFMALGGNSYPILR